MIWIAVGGYVLVTLVVAVLAAREFTPMHSAGDKASNGAVCLIAGAVWPIVVLGWVVSRLAEASKGGSG